MNRQFYVLVITILVFVWAIHQISAIAFIHTTNAFLVPGGDILTHWWVYLPIITISQFRFPWTLPK